jgi:hypothetical protein
MVLLLLFWLMIRKWLFCLLLVVLSPQPTLNPNPTLNQKQLILQKVIEDDVAGQHSLLLT